MDFAFQHLAKHRIRCYIFLVNQPLSLQLSLMVGLHFFFFFGMCLFVSSQGLVKLLFSSILVCFVSLNWFYLTWVHPELGFCSRTAL